MIDKKLALLKHLGVDYFTFDEDDFFIGDEDDTLKDFSEKCSEEYDEYFQDSTEGDDQTTQVPMSLEEWKESEGKTFENYCWAELSTVDDEVGNDYGNTFEYDGDEYLVLDYQESEDEYDERCESTIEDCYMCDIPKKGFLYNYLINNMDDLVEDYQTGTSKANELNGYDGTEGEEEIDGTTYYIYRQS